jgi:hydrogenase/urease accessory protein HupE
MIKSACSQSEAREFNLSLAFLFYMTLGILFNILGSNFPHVKNDTLIVSNIMSIKWHNHCKA